MSIAGSDDGRAFLACADGNLYELTYAADDGWLAQRPIKCRKMNRSASLLGSFVPAFVKHAVYAPEDPLRQVVVDSSRGILYTLSERSCIEARLIGAPTALALLNPNAAVALEASFKATNAGVVASLSATQWKAKLIDMCPRATDADMQLVALHVISAADSGHVHLVGVTARGSRLYFTTHSVDAWTSADQDDFAPPTTLRLLHARLLPPSLANAGVVSNASNVGSNNGNGSSGNSGNAKDQSANEAARCASYVDAHAALLPLARSADTDALLLTSLVRTKLCFDERECDVFS